MKFLEQIKYMALGALVILAIAYTSSSFDIESWAFLMALVMLICAEIHKQTKK